MKKKVATKKAVVKKEKPKERVPAIKSEEKEHTCPKCGRTAVVEEGDGTFTCLKCGKKWGEGILEVGEDELSLPEDEEEFKEQEEQDW